MSLISTFLVVYIVDTMDEEVMQAGSKGFIGCLSSVQFNHMAPLKAALLNRASSLVSVRGHLVESNCGALADSTIFHSQSGEESRMYSEYTVFLWTMSSNILILYTVNTEAGIEFSVYRFFHCHNDGSQGNVAHCFMSVPCPQTNDRSMM